MKIIGKLFGLKFIMNESTQTKRDENGLKVVMFQAIGRFFLKFFFVFRLSKDTEISTLGV